MRIGSTRSSSYWSSAAVCANAGRASIDKHGNRPRGTPDQAGRSIVIFQPRTSPACLSTVRRCSPATGQA